MECSYELVRCEEGLPIKAFIHSVNGLKMHWHNEIEILFILEGSVNIEIGNDLHVLMENDLILTNSNVIHSTRKTKEDNVLLALQIDPNQYLKYYPKFNNIIFDCNSCNYDKEEQEKFDVIRHHLAKIVWEINKKRDGFQLIVGSEIHLLLAYLINNFKDSLMEDEKSEIVHKDMERLQSIISYINENIDKRVTLQEIADREHLNVYYLSHFIKKVLGISFQEYLNIIRLEKAVKLLLSTDKTITEISYESGFPSTKSLNRLFKKEYDCSPSEYRRDDGKIDNTIENKDENIDKIRSRTYLDVDRNAAFTKLFTYLKPLDHSMEDSNIGINAKQSIYIDMEKEGTHYSRYWEKLITFGRASEGLRKGWQSQFKELQKEIGFEYIRFHGIFSDDMMITNINDDGNIVYNWTYVDELFDFFKEQNIKPFVELGFMPSELKKSDETWFWWKANISQPRDISLWTDLVVELIKHCINRYGKKEVETWYFEVWNEPDLEYIFWIGNKEEYFEFYKETVLAIKSVSNKLKVGGPSITYQTIYDERWLDDFLVYCTDNSVPLDFVSMHIYPESYSSKKQILDIALSLKDEEDIPKLVAGWEVVKRIYFSEDNTYDVLKFTNDIIDKLLPYKPEFHITEWNASAYDGNLIHDTCFVATFIVKNVLKSIGLVDSLGYWTFTDIMEERKADISPFHGGFGLINNNGLKKSSYMAYYLLSKLGDEIIEQGEEYIVTKSGEDIQILAYNFVYFDELFLSGDTSALTNEERYLVYEDKAEMEMQISIKGLLGHYKITRYQLNREHGSSYDEWLKIGAPGNMTEEEINYLKGRSYPKMDVEYLDIDGKYKESLYIPVHGVELIAIEKKL